MSVIRRMLRWCLQFFDGNTLGVVLGADSLRGIVPSRGTAWCEPAVAARRIRDQRLILDGQAIGLVTERLLVKAPNLVEIVRPFASDEPVDPYVLGRFLAYVGKSLSDPFPRWAPQHLVLACSPDLLRRIQPLLRRSASDAGFCNCRVLAEQRCLAAELGIAPGQPALAVDIGHRAVRFYAWRAGKPVARVEDTAISGAGVLRQMIDAAAAVNLEINESMARKILASYDDPSSGRPPLEVRGRDRTTGSPRRITDVPGIEAVLSRFSDALASTCRNMIVDAIKDPEVRIDLVGAGATARLEHSLRQRLAGMTIRRCPDPGMAAARGMMRLLSEEGAASSGSTSDRGRR